MKENLNNIKSWMPSRSQLVYYLALVISTLLLTEIVIRIVRPQPQLVRNYIGIDPEIGPVGKPYARYFDTKGSERWGYKYHVNTNNLGLRMNHDLQPESNRQKVLLLGNSIVFGWGNEIEDSFFGRLQQQFERDEILLLNGGYGTYSTGHSRKLAKQLLEHTAINDIVYFLSLGDVYNNLNRAPDYRVYEYSFNAQGEVKLEPTRAFRAWKRWLYMHTPYNWLNQHSHAFVFGKNFLNEVRDAAVEGLGRAGNMADTKEKQDGFVASSASDKTQPPPARESAAGKQNPEASEIRVEYSGVWDSEALDKAWLVTRAHLREFKSFCGEQGAGFIIVWLPSSREFKTGRVKPEAEILKQRLKREFGDLFLDLAAEYSNHAGAFEHDKLFFGDGHWTPLANRIFADALLPQLGQRLDISSSVKLVETAAKLSDADKTNN